MRPRPTGSSASSWVRTSPPARSGSRTTRQTCRTWTSRPNDRGGSVAQESMLGGRVEDVQLEDQIQTSYLDYSMSVIVGRALPDVRDGLKPVHRRILWSMFEQGLRPDRPYRKSANVVGGVMSKYHPHGDLAIYDALVRMAQDFSLRAPLVDGHGNFGSVDGDPPAAQRYTEARLAPIALELLRDIEAETVDLVPNYDGYEQQPVVLPARLPNLLVNGSGGIAVGMATNIPPHNLGEVVDAVVHFIEHPEAKPKDLMKFVKGPDFPTGAIVMGRDGIKEAYETGRGSIKVRAVCTIEEAANGRQRIVVTELPYQVNKARLAEKIADLVRTGRLKDVADVKDHSSGREGMRLVVELKRGANPQVVLNQLYKHTQLQDSFGVIMLSLVDGVPRTLNLAEMIGYYVDHQIDVVTRRTRHELKKAEERDHIVKGLLIALDNLDAVIKVIRGSQDAEEARGKLMSQFKLSEVQANHILDMPLRRLTRLARAELEQEHKDLLARIRYLKGLLKDPKKIRAVITDDLLEIRKKFANPRRTQLKADEGDLDVQDLIAEEDVVITVSRAGYVKRQPIENFRRQGRGGKGIRGANLKEEDVIDDDAQLAAVLHQQGEGLPREGPRGAGVRADRARDLRREPAGGLDHGGREGPGRDRPQGVRGGPVPPVRHPQGDGEEDDAARVRLAADRARRDQPEARRRADRRPSDRRQGRRDPRLPHGPGDPVQGEPRATDGPADRRCDRDAPGTGRRGDRPRRRVAGRGADQRHPPGVRQADAPQGLPGEGARRQGRDRPHAHEEDGPARRRVRRVEGPGHVRDLVLRDRDQGRGGGHPPCRPRLAGCSDDARRGGCDRRRARSGHRHRRARVATGPAVPRRFPSPAPAPLGRRDAPGGAAPGGTARTPGRRRRSSRPPPPRTAHRPRPTASARL